MGNGGQVARRMRSVGGGCRLRGSASEWGIGASLRVGRGALRRSARSVDIPAAGLLTSLNVQTGARLVAVNALTSVRQNKALFSIVIQLFQHL